MATPTQPTRILDVNGRPMRLSSVSGYDAANTSKNRKTPSTILKSEDRQLKRQDRDRLTSTIRDGIRNFSVARWALNKHLDFVSTHHFNASTEDAAFNEDLEGLMSWWADRRRCDVAGRHPLRRLIRMAEARRTVDGDVFIVRLAGGELQVIEGDRVRDPVDAYMDPDRYHNGVELDSQGRITHVNVHKRTSYGFEYERRLRSDRVFQFGYFDRFDQVRGISPMAAGINALRDVYAGFDYALAKAKVAQLFGLVIYRESMGGDFAMADEDDDAATSYDINFNEGPQLLDLDPGDRAEFLENNTPSSEFQDFTQAMIGVALKAMDLPYSFYDEAYTNFFGSRSALILYLKSARQKQRDVQDLLDDITRWKVAQWVGDGLLDLPPGRDISWVRWNWFPEGIEYWNPVQEIGADVMAIDAGIRTREDICLERYGVSWRHDVLPKLARENELMAEYGIRPTEGIVETIGAIEGAAETDERD